MNLFDFEYGQIMSANPHFNFSKGKKERIREHSLKHDFNVGDRIEIDTLRKRDVYATNIVALDERLVAGQKQYIVRFKRHYVGDIITYAKEDYEEKRYFNSLQDAIVDMRSWEEVAKEVW